MESEFYLKDGKKQLVQQNFPPLKTQGIAWITQNELMTTEK